MYITFNIPHAFHKQSNDVDNACALRDLLECMVELNTDYLKLHPNTPMLYQSGVKYGRTRLWEPIPALYARQLGDCKSLATARVAELRLRGIPCKPVFRFNPREDNNKDFHILVQVPKSISPTGWEDPSKILGMGADEASQYYIDSEFGFEGESVWSRLLTWVRR